VIYVIFPAFNEEDSIGPALGALRKVMESRLDDLTAVLVDDGSSDRTVDVAKNVASEADGKFRLEVLQHGDNRGLGAGLRTGIYGCLDRSRDHDVIVTLDADNTHPPSLIPEMVDKLVDGNDVVIASRYQPGAIVHGVPFHRRVISDVARIVFQVFFPFPGVRDYTCCFRAYRVSLLRQARIVYGQDFCTARGFEAVTDILLRVRQLDVRASEVPIELEYEQRVGRSKMRVIRTMTRTLTLLGQRFYEQFGKHSKGRVRARLRAAEASGTLATA